jgi:hypothetical protein
MNVQSVTVIVTNYYNVFWALGQYLLVRVILAVVDDILRCTNRRYLTNCIHSDGTNL